MKTDNFDYVRLEYPTDFLMDLAARGGEWARRELMARGMCDYMDADVGEERVCQ